MHSDAPGYECHPAWRRINNLCCMKSVPSICDTHGQEGHLGIDTVCPCLMSRHDVQRAQQQWRAFLAEAPAYPQGLFSGRGVVILSGSLQYMVPAWVNLHMLRLTGKRLTA